MDSRTANRHPHVESKQKKWQKSASRSHCLASEPVRSLMHSTFGCIFITLVVTFSLAAQDLHVYQCGDETVCHITNTTGIVADGLRIGIDSCVEPQQVLGLGTDSLNVSTGDQLVIITGRIPPQSTIEICWPRIVSPMLKAEWLLDGKVLGAVNCLRPTARFSFMIFDELQTIRLNAAGSGDLDGLPLAEYRWLWSDGVEQIGRVVDRILPSTERFSVTLTVRNAAGVEGMCTRHINVARPIQPSTTNGKLYVNNFDAGTTSVIDLATGEVIATIDVGQGPSKLVIANGKVYVANRGSGTVSVIDTITNTVVQTLPTGSNSWQIAYHDGFVYLGANSQIAVIDPSIDQVVATISGVSRSRGIAFASGKGYVTSENTNSVVVFDTATHSWLRSIAIGSNPKGIITVGSNVYAFNNGSNSISVINSLTDTVENTIPTGLYPHQPSYVNGVLYSATSLDDSISMIDVESESMIGQIPVGDYPGSTSTFDGIVYAPNMSSRSLSLINTATNAVAETIVLRGIPHSALVVGARVYVSLIDSGGVEVIDFTSGEVETFIPTGGGTRYMQVLIGSF